LTQNSRIYPCGAGSGAAKKLGESASTAPAGLLPCNKMIVNFIILRVYHVSFAGRLYCTPVLAFIRWSVTAETVSNSTREGVL
jgi:hypothetical protein